MTSKPFSSRIRGFTDGITKQVYDFLMATYGEAQDIEDDIRKGRFGPILIWLVIGAFLFFLLKSSGGTEVSNSGVYVGGDNSGTITQNVYNEDEPPAFQFKWVSENLLDNGKYQFSYEVSPLTDKVGVINYWLEIDNETLVEASVLKQEDKVVNEGFVRFSSWPIPPLESNEPLIDWTGGFDRVPPEKFVWVITLSKKPSHYSTPKVESGVR